MSVVPTPFATYQWIDCDINQPIIGETNMVYTATSSGNYAVEVSVDGCTLTSSCFNVDMSSINAGIWEGLSFHPNPVMDEMTIWAPNLNQDLSIEIYDAQSKLIKVLELNNATTIKVDFSAYSSGLYFIKLKAADAIFNYKIVKD